MVLKKIFIRAFLLTSIFSISTSFSQKILEDFESYDIGKMSFSGWYTTSIKGDPHDVYTIAKEKKNLYMHADSLDTYTHAYRKKGWGIEYYPILTWKWRVLKHPEGAKPETKPSNSAASVYIVFRKSLLPLRFQSLKYVWAATGEVGHVKRSGGKHPQVQIIVRSGDADLGKWVTEERNVEEDYKKYFDSKRAKSPMAFGVLTDTDVVKKQAIGDYDDFIALKESKLPQKPVLVLDHKNKASTDHKDDLVKKETSVKPLQDKTTKEIETKK